MQQASAQTADINNTIREERATSPNADAYTASSSTACFFVRPPKLARHLQLAIRYDA